MKNKLWILLILIIVVLIGIGIYFYNKFSNSNEPDYSVSRTSVNETNTQNNSEITNTSISNQENTNSVTESNTKQEELLSTFSTKIYTKDTGRQNNVGLTCNTLNGTIVKSGSEFSFCNTVGRASPDRGYLKAEIFDKDGNKIQGYGGGNCQISSTLYNAVLQISDLEVTERHPHSNKVPYIQSGRDAAVAFGSYDFKFKNNSGYDIRIDASNTPDIVTISLIKI